jgi:hypothetical protein
LKILKTKIRTQPRSVAARLTVDNRVRLKLRVSSYLIEDDISYVTDDSKHYLRKKLHRSILKGYADPRTTNHPLTLVGLGVSDLERFGSANL